MESSPRDLLNDKAEHMSIFKNNQCTNFPRSIFTPKTEWDFFKTGVPFSMWGSAILPCVPLTGLRELWNMGGKLTGTGGVDYLSLISAHKS